MRNMYASQEKYLFPYISKDKVCPTPQWYKSWLKREKKLAIKSYWYQFVNIYIRAFAKLIEKGLDTTAAARTSIEVKTSTDVNI